MDDFEIEDTRYAVFSNTLNTTGMLPHFYIYIFYFIFYYIRTPAIAQHRVIFLNILTKPCLSNLSDKIINYSNLIKIYCYFIEQFNQSDMQNES